MRSVAWVAAACLMLAGPVMAEEAAKPAPDAYQLLEDRAHAVKTIDEFRPLLPEYEAFANAGDLRAMFRLANVTLLWGDKDTSVKWLRRMADLNDPKGQYYLAASLPGMGDCSESRGLLEKSANGGYETAVMALAFYYEQGRCGPKDLEKAVVWYEKGARLGYGVAQNNLAYMYLNGEGVKRDPVVAYAWFELASRQPRGSYRTQDWMPSDASEQAETAAKRMSPDRQEKGWKLAQTLCAQDKVCAYMPDYRRQQLMEPFVLPAPSK